MCKKVWLRLPPETIPFNPKLNLNTAPVKRPAAEKSTTEDLPRYAENIVDAPLKKKKWHID